MRCAPEDSGLGRVSHTPHDVISYLRDLHVRDSLSCCGCVNHTIYCNGSDRVCVCDRRERECVCVRGAWLTDMARMYACPIFFIRRISSVHFIARTGGGFRTVHLTCWCLLVSSLPLQDATHRASAAGRNLFYRAHAGDARFQQLQDTHPICLSGAPSPPVLLPADILPG